MTFVLRITPSSYGLYIAGILNHQAHEFLESLDGFKICVKGSECVGKMVCRWILFSGVRIQRGLQIRCLQFPLNIHMDSKQPKQQNSQAK